MNNSALAAISAVRDPNVIGAMQALTNVRKNAIAKDVQDQQDEDAANTSSKLEIGGNGRPVVTVSMPVGDPRDVGDQEASELDRNLQSNISTFNALNEKAKAAGPTMSKADTWKRAYNEAMMRQGSPGMGGGLLHMAIGGLLADANARGVADTTPQPESPEAAAASNYYDKAVKPLFEQVESSRRFSRLFKKDEFGTLNGIDYSILPEGQSPKEAAESRLGHALNPQQETAVNLIANQQQYKKGFDRYEESRKDKGALGAFSSYADVKDAFGDAPNPRLEAQRMADYDAAHRDYQFTQTQRKGALALQAAEIQLHQADIMQRERQQKFALTMQQLNTPEAIDQTAKAALEDGNQYHNIDTSTPEGKLYQQVVAARIKQATGGYLPAAIKPGSPDSERLITAQQGRQDVAYLRNNVDTWHQKGVDIAGAFRGALLNQIVEGNPATKVGARIAAQQIPGFSKLSPADQQQFLQDAATDYHRSLSLTARETKSNMSGRPGERIFEFFKAATPNISKDYTTLHGLLDGADMEFDNTENAIRQSQWGGHAPAAALHGNTGRPGGPNGNVTKIDPAALDRAIGYKPKK